MTYRTAYHDYVVEVFYPTELSRDALDEVISQDAHDIIKALRDSASWKGYDASNTTTDIGLKSRIEISDQVNETRDQWVLQLKFKCLITETE